ncbi:MAG: hypothetical protein ACRBBP_10180 [Bdellovibrionales bacterium]
MKVKFKILFFCVLSGLCFSDAVYARSCSRLIDLVNVTSGKKVKKVLTEHDMNRAGVIEFVKGIAVNLMHKQANSNMIIAQTVYLSGKSAAEVLEYFRTFPETGLNRHDAAHNILVQTALLTRKPSLEILELFGKVPVSVRGNMNDLARAFMLQNSLFANVSVERVVEFLLSAPRIPYDKRSLSSHLILQTAFLTERSVSDVLKDFRSFPYVSTGTQTGGLEILKQTALYAER